MKGRKTVRVLLTVVLAFVLTVFGQTASITQAASVQPADIVLQNGAIYTVDKNRSVGQAIAISDDKIVYVGTNDGVKAWIGPKTKVTDLKERTVLPGFFDAHTHVSTTAELLFAVNVSGMETVEESVHAVQQFIKKNPDLKAVQGSGWKNAIALKTGPGKEALDKVAPTIPVALYSEDHHSLWVNSKALELAGITKGTPNPKGGIIERSGTLRESAMDLVMDVFPDFTVEQYSTFQ